MSQPKLRVASGSQEDPVHRRAEQEAPREIPVPLTTEALAARGDSLQHLRRRVAVSISCSACPASLSTAAGGPEEQDKLRRRIDEYLLQEEYYKSFRGEDGEEPLEALETLDQMLLKEVMAENRGLTLSDLKKRSPEHLLATLTGCESPNGYLKPAAVKQDADDQLSEITSNIPPGDPTCVELKHSAFLAQVLLEEVDLESPSEPTSPVGKPVLHMQHTHSGEPVAQSPDALARSASNNMPLSEHDTQEL